MATIRIKDEALAGSEARIELRSSAYLQKLYKTGTPDLLNSLVRLGDELWLESTDPLREDKFYRYNQSLPEFFNFAARSH